MELERVVADNMVRALQPEKDILIFPEDFAGEVAVCSIIIVIRRHIGLSGVIIWWARRKCGVVRVVVIESVRSVKASETKF